MRILTDWNHQRERRIEQQMQIIILLNVTENNMLSTSEIKVSHTPRSLENGKAAAAGYQLYVQKQPLQLYSNSFLSYRSEFCINSHGKTRKRPEH